MARTKVKLHHPEFRKLLMGSEVSTNLRRRARRIAGEAGPGYYSDRNSERKTRAGYTVYPGTPEAIESEARDHHLLDALDAGRD